MNPELEVGMRKKWSPGPMGPSLFSIRGSTLKSPPWTDATTSVRTGEKRKG